MRRRLFWTIAGVAAVTGLLVLAGSAFASQRAAVEATYREMRQSSQEAVAIIEDTLERAERRPGATQELFRLLQGEQLGPLLGRIRRTAGGSDIAFAVIPANGDPRFSSDLFERVSFDQDILESGHTQFTRSSTGELVVITPTEISVRNTDVTLLVGLAREAPIVRLADQFRGMLVIIVGIGLLSALLARLLSRSVASRLEPLAVASRGLADGDLSARVPDLEDPELNEVASAFNEMAEELEASQIRERDFILGIGHDLRTPLTTIGGYAEALEGGDFDPEDIERIGGVLGVQSRQLGRLIEDLSTLAQMEQPEFSLRTEKVDVGAHVKEVVDGFSRHAKEIGVTLSIETSEGLVLETDPDRVGQIAQNLVENAMRYTPETGTVTVVVREEGPVYVIEVADTGIGIAPEDLPYIFDRHYVGKQRKLRNEGSGLGLSIVKGLVERMGGEVTADSAPGKGTTITVSLPA
jgi:two-component system sensor histidine kinase BaeS